MPEYSELKNFGAGSSVNTDDAPETLQPNEVSKAVNVRFTGTSQGGANYAENIEANQLIAGSLLPGLNTCNGGGAFEDIRAAVLFRPNSAGNNQILYYDYDSNSYEVIFTDVTDSGGIPILPLDPSEWVTCILINKTYLIWTAKNLEVGYTNLNTLKSGGYGTVLAEDLSLLKPQCIQPPTGTYGSDLGTPENAWFGVLPQLTVQYVNDDFNYSAWSTRSKRIAPYQQNTPTSGSSVSQNNYIVWGVNIGSVRATTINIAAQYDDSGQFYQIKSQTRAYITALSNTSVNVSAEVYEAYDPTTNTYYFVDYNTSEKIPVDMTETNLFYDYIWFGANACEVLNGNIAAIADWTLPYTRPVIPVTVAAVGYNPNIGIPAGTYPNPLMAVADFPGASGSGAGDHRRIIWIQLGGIPRTGDQILVYTADIRNSSATRFYPYTVPAGLNGNLAGVVAAYTETFPSSSYKANSDGTYTITWIDQPYYGLQSFVIDLFFAGATVANSIASIPDDATCQLALSFFDKKMRPLPLCTDNTYIIKSPSYAQVNGQAIKISAIIGTTVAPPNAFYGQWMITKPIAPKILDTTGILLNYIGTWDASTNTPALGINGLNSVGDTYQVSVPASPAVPTSYHNIGNNATYNTGDYVVYNGRSWDVLDRSFGDLTPSGNIMAISLNPLNLFNQSYSDEGVSTVLAYDFAAGDRCTFHWYGSQQYFNNPCINLSVLGYDAGSYIVKVERSAALNYASGVKYNGSSITAQNIFLRLYSPGLSTQSQTAVSATTEWFEIGEMFTITNGTFDQTVFNLYDGGCYYKTRQFPDALKPYANPPVQTFSTDYNYSDFYASAFWSKGRPRTFYDVLENTEQKAEIITSLNYIIGSKNNGLNRMYPGSVYGDSDGQCSSSKGAIQVLWQRGDVLVVIQERSTFYVPVNYTWTIVNDQITGTALSEKLLNNGRYSASGIGIGTAKESFCRRYDVGYFLDPNNSLPMIIRENGVFPIGEKRTKYFKTIIQSAYAIGKKLVQYYDTYHEEVLTCIQGTNAMIKLFQFTSPDWQPENNYIILPGQITATDGAHSTVSYNKSTGIATYVPNPNYVGNDKAMLYFTVSNTLMSVNVCMLWTAASGSINPIAFTPQTGVPLSTEIQSNTVLINGNDYGVPISITGGQYSINGGPFVSTPGTVYPNQIVQVQVLSSNLNSTPTSCTLTVDGQSATFTVTTLASGNLMVSAKYGINVLDVYGGTAVISPSDPGFVNLSSGNSGVYAYTTITGGTINVTISGEPGVVPGHVQLYLSVNGFTVDQQTIIGGKSLYQLTLPTMQTNPTPIAIGVQLV